MRPASFVAIRQPCRATHALLTLLALAAACNRDVAAPRVAGVPVALRITPDSVDITLPAGTRRLDATLRDAAGVPTEAIGVAWRTVDPQLAEVTTTGQVGARGWGRARIIATLGAFADTAIVRVVAPPPTLTWTFTVEIGVRATEAVLSDAELVRQGKALMDTISSRFNEPGTFDGRFQWTLIRSYRLTGPAQTELSKPLVADYRVLLDPEASEGSGYYGMHTALMGGNSYQPEMTLFSDPIPRAVAHEFGHARGAVDLYAEEVQLSARNTVNGSTWFGPRSMMTDLSRGWDGHSRHVINTNANRSPESVVGGTPRELQDSLEIHVVDASGAAVEGATVESYPVRWRTWRVDPPALWTATTDAKGIAGFRNPLRDDGNVANVLVVAHSGSRNGESWAPYSEAQLSWWLGNTRRYAVTVVVR